jgi:hypothetical protein
MCQLEDVQHACAHWGRPEFVGEPCPSSAIVNGRPQPCHNAVVDGMRRDNGGCPQCKASYPSGTKFWSWADYVRPNPVQVAEEERDDVPKKKRLSVASIDKLLRRLGRPWTMIKRKLTPNRPIRNKC